jgi:imidazole glycerol-phosphate synthase subunit HisH
MTCVGIIDYGMGNLGSVRRKLDRIGIPSIITSHIAEIKACSHLILPGVGHFGKAVDELKRRRLWDVLNEAVLTDQKPILGICLGMQLMAKHSEEGDAIGFGWFDAEVIRCNVGNTIKYKVPHTGWNHAEVKKPSPLFADVDLSRGFYFVHAYCMKCNDPEDILAVTEYSFPFISAIEKGNIFGVQFHPEKSHDAGERLLRNFVSM